MQEDRAMTLQVRSSSLMNRDLIVAARAVVTAHSLRDQGRRSDEDVSDAVADLRSCLDEIRRQGD
jgi:hypothetical protein